MPLADVNGTTLHYRFDGLEHGPTESIQAVSTQTLVVVGEHDPGTPVSAAEFIHERIASSELRVISDAAHFVNVEQADLFNDILLEFLEKMS